MISGGRIRQQFYGEISGGHKVRTNFTFWKGWFEWFDSSCVADHLRDPVDRVQLRKVFLVLQVTQLRSQEISEVH